MTKYSLYSYFRSSASHRVRIALNCKNIPYELKPIHLLKDGGQQYLENYKKINPLSTIPLLEFGPNRISQSMAIIEYLDLAHPEPRLLPMEPVFRCQVIEFCEVINSGVQPFQNLATLKQLETQFQASASEKEKWVQNFIQKGFLGLEKRLQSTSGKFCFGGSVTAADAFLIPQVLGAQRFKVNLEEFPIIRQIFSNCMEIPAFVKAAPENQPDYELIK